jgi:predicted transcriptional regulator
MSSITVTLSDECLQTLKSLAAEARTTPEALASQVIETMLDQERKAFQKALEYVLRKNRELYERLAR